MAVAAAAVPTTRNDGNIGPAASAKSCADAAVHGQATGAVQITAGGQCSTAARATAHRCMAVARDAAQMVLCRMPQTSYAPPVFCVHRHSAESWT